MSYTAQFLKEADEGRGLTVLDEVGSKIMSFTRICHETDFSTYKPRMPTLSVDRFSENRVVIDLAKTEILKQGYVDLMRMGYVVISLPAGQNRANRQKVFYKLCPLHSIPQRAIKITGLPRDHRIRFDYVNKLLRIEGPNAYNDRTGVRRVSEWVPVINKE